MELIRCSEDDIAILAEYNSQLIQDEQSGNMMSLDELQDRMQNFFKEGYQAYYIVEQDTKIGYLLVDITKQPLFLRHFLILSEHRRKGYGTKAFRLLCQLLQTDEMEIQVLTWNTPALSFFQKCGFKDKERYRKFVLAK